MALTKDFSEKVRTLIAAGQYHHTLTGNLLLPLEHLCCTNWFLVSLVALKTHVGSGTNLQEDGWRIRSIKILE